MPIFSFLVISDLGLEGGPGVTQPLAGQEAEAEGGDTEEHSLVEGEGGLLDEVTELVRGDPEHQAGSIKL